MKDRLLMKVKPSTNFDGSIKFHPTTKKYLKQLSMRIKRWFQNIKELLQNYDTKLIVKLKEETIQLIKIQKELIDFNNKVNLLSNDGLFDNVYKWMQELEKILGSNIK